MFISAADFERYAPHTPLSLVRVIERILSPLSLVRMERVRVYLGDPQSGISSTVLTGRITKHGRQLCVHNARRRLFIGIQSDGILCITYTQQHLHNLHGALYVHPNYKEAGNASSARSVQTTAGRRRRRHIIIRNTDGDTDA